MSIVSLEQIKGMLRGMFGVVNKDIAKVQEAANKAQEESTNAQSVASDALQNVASKMDADNPVGTGSFSMGRRSGQAVGANSHAEGDFVAASGDWSHAEGYFTTASGAGSHAEGHTTTASGAGSHAEGKSTTASGAGSHAEGYDTTASGDRSHAEGSVTTASGIMSHAEGETTTASGRGSHAEGYFTTAYGHYQHAQGKYNIEDTRHRYAHIVGNGTDFDERSNAHTLDWDGNAWYAGDVYVGGTSQEDAEKLMTATETSEAIANALEGFDGKDGASGVHIGADTPAGDEVIWFNPNGTPSNTETWEFTLSDGSIVTKTVVIV